MKLRINFIYYSRDYLRYKVYNNFQVLLSKNISQLKTKLYDFLSQKVHVYVVIVAELLTLRKTKISLCTLS